MTRIHLLSQAVAKFIVTPRGDLEEQIDAIACYIGLGDQFDDDRRRVRASASASASAFRPAIRPTSDGVSARTNSADNRSPRGPKAAR